jgi:hypothetical protein
MTVYIGLFHVLRVTNFCPPLMLGDGDSMLMFGNWPYTVKPPMMKYYYMLSLSYYTEDLVNHLILPPNFDYWEMVLHHVITGMLIVGSYINGFWNIGVFVLVQMDVEDIFIGLVRIYPDFASIFTTSIIYLCIMASWIWLRFIAYWQITLRFSSFIGRLAIDNDTLTQNIISVLLIVLFYLNIYWFVLLLMMGYRLAFKNTAEDLQNVIKISKENKVE